MSDLQAMIAVFSPVLVLLFALLATIAIDGHKDRKRRKEREARWDREDAEGRERMERRDLRENPDFEEEIRMWVDRHFRLAEEDEIPGDWRTADFDRIEAEQLAIAAEAEVEEIKWSEVQEKHASYVEDSGEECYLDDCKVHEKQEIDHQYDQLMTAISQMIKSDGKLQHWSDCDGGEWDCCGAYPGYSEGKPEPERVKITDRRRTDEKVNTRAIEDLHEAFRVYNLEKSEAEQQEWERERRRRWSDYDDYY